MNNRKEITFDVDEFITALEETADHVNGKRKITMRTTIVPTLVDTIKARDRTMR